MSSSSKDVVRSYFIDHIGVIAINNPPVNAISHEVRSGIVNALKELNQADIDHIILHCDGNTFSAGADIKEFGQTPIAPHLPEVVSALNNNPIPVIALLHGTTLGGGLEIAMACYARVAAETCRIGLPEVSLGLIPGAGGTQLLPKLVGYAKAAEMITSGKLYSVKEFDDTALIHTILPVTAETNANSLLKQIINLKSQITDYKEISFILDDVNWADVTAKTKRIAKGRIAPLRAIEVLQSTYDVPLDVGLRIERKVFLELRESDQSQALRHAFVAERTATKYQAANQARGISQIAVIGGGTMGCGIATTLINAGYHVILVEREPSVVTRAKNTVVKYIQAALSRGLISTQKYHQTIGLFECTSELGDIASADLVIEAIFEDLQVKRELFSSLDKICTPEAIFATNTSYLDIDSMSEVLENPSRLVGMHFFSPAHIMKLVEIIATQTTSETAIATAFSVAKRAKKIPVKVGNCYGFAGNRMYQRYGREVQQLLLEGATVEQIDSAMTNFGMAMGPLAVQDLAGIDVGHKARLTRPFPEYDPGFFKVSEWLVSKGNYGRKTGVGFYDYQNDEQTPNLTINEDIRTLADSLGIEQTNPDEQMIQHRALMALINEGYQLLSEGIVQRASDLDVIWIYGYGFPRYKGGPMHMAKTMDKDELQESMNTLSQYYGEQIWPSIQP